MDWRQKSGLGFAIGDGGWCGVCFGAVEIVMEHGWMMDNTHGNRMPWFELEIGLFVIADWEVRVRTGLGCGDGGCCEVVRELQVWVHGLVITMKARDLVFWEWAVAR
ncbi:hypothetical protein M0R45_008892 [Rubus argutus]|uniref:Uncharacterized protein n=1 Tax=Rubus argutus TaxID=59490 RepID=A0AAW1Y3D2_RUBAR